MSPLALPLSIDDLELAFFKEQYAEGYGKQTGKVILQRNLCTNPSGKYGLTGWTAKANQPISSDAVTYPAGFSSSVKINFSAAITGGTNAASYDSSFYSTNAVIGKTYYTTIKVYADTACTIAPALQAGNNRVFGVVTALTANTWYTFKVSGMQTLNTTVYSFLSLREVPLNTNINMVVGISVDKDLDTIFNGDTTDLNGITYDWEGTPGNSSSIKWSTEPIGMENLIQNPEPVDNVFNATSQINATRAAVNYQGKQCYRLTANGVSTRFSLIHLTPNASPWDAGTYTIKFKYATTESGVDSISVQAYDANTATMVPTLNNVTLDANPVRDGSFKEVSITFTSSIPFTYVYMQFVGASITAGMVGYIADSVMMKGTTAFYNSPRDRDSFWTGTPELSSSIRRDVRARNIDFLEREYYAKGSGLTPKEQYSVADHMLAFLRNNFKAVAGGPTTVVRTNRMPDPKSKTPANWLPTNAAVSLNGTNDAVRLVANGSGSFSAANFSIAGFSGFKNIPDGKLYVSFDVKTNKPTVAVQVNVVGVGNRSVVLTPGIADQFVRVSGFIDLVGGTETTNLQVVNNTDINNYIEFKNFVVEYVPSDNTYFDGDSGNNYRWSGTPNASTSEQVDPSKHGITDLLMSYRINKSNLPVKRSSADHELSLYKIALGLNPAWDDFNRADGAAGNAASGQSWVSWLTAGWAIANNALRWTGASDGALVINSGYSDKYSIAFSVLEVNGNFPIGFIVRGTANNDFIKIYHRSTQKDWNLQYNGGAIITISGNGSVQSGDYLKCVVNGTDISIYVNDALQGTFTGITSVPTGTYQGVIGSGGLATTIDKFMIEKL